MSSWLCPRLVTLKDLILLFVRLFNVLFSLFKSLLRVLLKKRALLSRNPPDKSFLLEGCTYRFLAAIKVKDRRNL
jgi:hypothetical protein